MNKTMWAIHFINVRGERGLVNKKGYPATIDDMPFFKTKENAENASKEMQRHLDTAIMQKEVLKIAKVQIEIDIPEWEEY